MLLGISMIGVAETMNLGIKWVKKSNLLLLILSCQSYQGVKEMKKI